MTRDFWAIPRPMTQPASGHGFKAPNTCKILVGLCGCRCRLADPGRCLAKVPSFPTNPALGIASCSNEIILQSYFGQTPIACMPQAVGSHQFALSAFNSVAMFHPLLESRCLLLLPARLQGSVVLADNQRAMSLAFAQTLRTQRAVLTLSTELESVANIAGEGLQQTAALGINSSGRTDCVP